MATVRLSVWLVSGYAHVFILLPEFPLSMNSTVPFLREADLSLSATTPPSRPWP